MQKALILVKKESHCVTTTIIKGKIPGTTDLIFVRVQGVYKKWRKVRDEA
jgi:hypothetical protein